MSQTLPMNVTVSSKNFKRPFLRAFILGAIVSLVSFVILFLNSKINFQLLPNWLPSDLFIWFPLLFFILNPVALPLSFWGSSISSSPGVLISIVVIFPILLTGLCWGLIYAFLLTRRYLGWILLVFYVIVSVIGGYLGFIFMMSAMQ